MTDFNRLLKNLNEEDLRALLRAVQKKIDQEVANSNTVDPEWYDAPGFDDKYSDWQVGDFKEQWDEE